MLFYLLGNYVATNVFIIGKWGKLSSEKAAYSYLIYSGIGSAILLIVFLNFVRENRYNKYCGAERDIKKRKRRGELVIPSSLQLGVFIAIMIALQLNYLFFRCTAGWSMYIEAHPAVVMLHAGVLLKIGAYGIIRFGKGLFRNIFTMLQR